MGHGTGSRDTGACIVICSTLLLERERIGERQPRGLAEHNVLGAQSPKAGGLLYGQGGTRFLGVEYRNQLQRLICRSLNA